MKAMSVHPIRSNFHQNVLVDLISNFILTLQHIHNGVGKITLISIISRQEIIIISARHAIIQQQGDGSISEAILVLNRRLEFTACLDWSQLENFQTSI